MKKSKLAQLKKSANVSKLAKMKEQQQTIPEAKPAGLTVEGLAMVKDLRKEIESIKSYTMQQNVLIKELTAQQAKLYEVVFNNGNDEIIALLKQINLKQSVSVPAKEITANALIDAGEEMHDKANNENLFQHFKKYFSGNVTEENFNKAMKADFTSIETLTESLKVIEKKNQDEGKGFLCARKSKKQFIAALWQTINDIEKPNSKNVDSSASPVFDSKYFAKALEIDEDTVKELFDIVDNTPEFTDEFENDLLEAMLEENADLPEQGYEEFIEFVQNYIAGQ